MLEQAAAMDARTVDLLKAQPMSAAAVAKTLEMATSTAQKRLHKLEAQGRIACGDGGLWTAFN